MSTQSTSQTNQSTCLGIVATGAGQAAGSLVVPAADVIAGAYRSLRRKYDYIKNLGKNYAKLETEARYLSSREKDISDLIAKSQVMEEATHECATWLEDMRKMTRDLNDLETKYLKLNHGSCRYSQLHTRLKLSKEIHSMTESVIDCRERMNLERILLKEKTPEKVEMRFPKRIDEVPSLHENVEKLIEFLKDDNVKKIGIWGLPGVGKTTILENLNNEVEKLQLFEIVLWVTVPKEGSIRQIQQEILRRLSLKVEGVTYSESQATALITKALENKKYLLLLDDVSSKFDLHYIGIHDSHNQGKVVLATRKRMICYAMDMGEMIKVERLSREDAHKLFRDVVGEVCDHPAISPIAKRVLKQCGELPQVIRAIGIYLKEKHSELIWLDTLSKLQSPHTYPHEHIKNVFTTFQLIYEELRGTMKDCLLYAASFPEDYEIYRDHLVECWTVEQLTGVGETLKKAYEEGHTNLETLLEKCLFDRCKRAKYVHMPIIFRNAALKMAYQQNFGLLMINEELEDNAKVEKWRNARVISMINSKSKLELPERPECPRISTLFLQKHGNMKLMPAPFFENMSTLKILDLFGTSIEILPPSISMLINLRGLYLNDCPQLSNLPEDIEKLMNLEILDICRSGIHGLPHVLGKLTHLRCLRVSFASSSSNQSHSNAEYNEVPPPIIFEQLHLLEQLAIDAHSGDPCWKTMAPIIVEQVARLRKLNNLSFHFPSTESLETFTQTSTPWKNGNAIGNSLNSFNIYVGTHKIKEPPQIDILKCSGQRYFQYSGGDGTPNVIKQVLGRSCAFKLFWHQNITSLSDFGVLEMAGLDICIVEECSTIETLVDGSKVDASTFPWLRELHVLKLQSLNTIWQGPIPAASFARLKKLIIFECPKVTKLVSQAMAKQLISLEHLRVEKCNIVEEIVEMDSQSRGVSALPKLKVLELVHLEALVGINCNGSLQWHTTVQELEIIGCERLVNLNLSTTNATKLRRIKCCRAWWEALTLSEEIKRHLKDFCYFIGGN